MLKIITDTIVCVCLVVCIFVVDWIKKYFFGTDVPVVARIALGIMDLVLILSLIPVVIRVLQEAAKSMREVKINARGRSVFDVKIYRLF